jgi:hypothetical protein
VITSVLGTLDMRYACMFDGPACGCTPDGVVSLVSFSCTYVGRGLPGALVEPGCTMLCVEGLRWLLLAKSTCLCGDWDI